MNYAVNSLSVQCFPVRGHPKHFTFTVKEVVGVGERGHRCPVAEGRYYTEYRTVWGVFLAFNSSFLPGGGNVPSEVEAQAHLVVQQTS